MLAEVIVDDRLATVLATAPAGAAGARTQYRQLLDILGRMPPDFALPAPALARLGELEHALPADERAALIRAAPSSLRHPGLVLRLSEQSPAVAAAALTSARLDDWQWSALTLELPLAARGHLRHRRDLGPRTRAVLARLGIADLGLPSPEGAEAGSAVAEASLPEGEGIGAIVRRIEAFRRSRQAGTRQFGGEERGPLGDPQLPLREFVGDAPAAPTTAIGIVSDAAGRIAWAEGRFAPMLGGMRLGSLDPSAPARTDPATSRALAEWRPVNAGRVEIVGARAVAGSWRIDASPRFDSATGRFLGYRGLLRRPAGGVAAAPDSPADRLRQLLHELRTPVNAIQGFAELIQQQLFGPTPHQYRSLAATIAADSAAILAGFDEIERLVRLATGRSESMAGHCDLAALVARVAGQIGEAVAARGATVTFDAAGPAPAAMDEADAERLVWRILATLAAAATADETLALELRAVRQGIELEIPLPSFLARQDDARLFAVEAGDGGEPGALSLLGGGFALRLAQAEAHAAGGSLRRVGGLLLLRLPGLTPSADVHSPGPSDGSDRAEGA